MKKNTLSSALPRQGSYFNPLTCTKSYPAGLAVVRTPNDTENLSGAAGFCSWGRLAKILRSSMPPQFLVAWIGLKVHDCTNVKTGSGLSVLRGFLLSTLFQKNLACEIDDLKCHLQKFLRNKLAISKKRSLKTGRSLAAMKPTMPNPIGTLFF